LIARNQRSDFDGANMTSKNNYIEVTVTDGHEQGIALQRAHKLIESDPALQYCMLDTSADGKTLLVFYSCSHDPTHVERSMNRVWQGDVEVLNASMFANNT
jgi:hypothetical protein